ncbi:MAG: MinD/ParA family protein [Deltaproteobacteria bacterium]|nr:MinD/ParA family protein [Deltaproteobacteria bacterium]
MGRSVAILDGDLGLANINVLLGLRPVYNIYDVLAGNKMLEETVLDGPEGVVIIPAASGIRSACGLSTAERLTLMQAIEDFAYDFDYLLVDTPAGLGEDVMYFNSASAEVVCVINDEPTSLTDAYALIKVLSRDYGEKSISILVNNIADQKKAEAAYRRLSRAVERFLQVELRYLGYVPCDSAVNAAVIEQKALLEAHPSSVAAVALSALARRLDSEFHDYRVKGGMQFFFRQLLDVSAYGQ